MKEKIKFGVLGTGAFGSALANILIENNFPVMMYGINAQEISDINDGYNRKFFGEIPFKNSNLISATNDLGYFYENVDTVILAVPSVAVGVILRQSAKVLGNKKISIINLSKGLEPETKQFFSDYITSAFDNNLENLASIMGPSFAIEVFEGKLTMVNIVGINSKFNQEVAQCFNNSHFYVKPYDDIKGAEVFAALKNVLAIGLGMSSVLYPGQNSHAGLLTLGTYEIFKIYKTMFPNEEDTIGYNFAAMGDIFLTCSSPTSRNFSFGINVAKVGVSEALATQNVTTEGYDTAITLQKIIEEYNIKDIPFLQGIIDVLFNNKDPKVILDSII
ncbi:MULTISPECIES: NAD(P)H-dependent glycerol-3-phosphate dehydrogenase [unclassified Mycoplasma]|uniref:NAD(P)H-dependent glycerol-3-phosphate dehydrogenase n=1 Tax=unclassified Mycoplasma TaxID=2683645 RepID=UPI002B1D64D2|nr:MULTISPECIES: NAD(P)H-dependent glycerol-3-phosphate dehydrogenase [unclassified Mycoplasma]MEA4191307.1 NAD(P)H-dependent glycerol-3-phosphate dehydrogenase [Mycoplasma sp. 2248]MEA4206455.1 NAD(P)H-dependent glycerol-3-phosphate dehydrogenase [Mycoplasma sp. 1199]